MRIPFLVLAAVLCASCALHAQASPDAHEAHTPKDVAQWQLYGGYSFQSNTYNGAPGHTQSLNGWEASIDFPYIWHGLRVKADFTQYRGHNWGAQQNSYSITGGFKYDKKFGRETLFGEVLAGDVAVNKYWGPNAAMGYTTSFTTAVGGGIDTPIAHHLAIRVGGDWIYTNLYLQNTTPTLYRQPVDFPGRPNYFAHVTTGVIWKF